MGHLQKAFADSITRLWSGTGVTGLVIAPSPDELISMLDLPLSIAAEDDSNRGYDVVIADVTKGSNPLASHLTSGFPLPPGCVIILTTDPSQDLTLLGILSTTVDLVTPVVSDDQRLGFVARLTSSDPAHQAAASRFETGLALSESQSGEADRALRRLDHWTEMEAVALAHELRDAKRATLVATEKAEAASRLATKLEKQLHAINTSTSLRVGRLATSPVRILRSKRSSSRSVPASEPSQGEPMRQEYESITRATPLLEGTSVRFACFTTSFNEGRGDVFVAVGLAKYLNRLGVSTSFSSRPDWYSLTENADAMVAMLPQFDPSRVGPGTLRVAWVRNATDQWALHPRLGEFDLILTTSSQSQKTLQAATGTQVDLLPIAVDHEWFVPPDRDGHRRGVLTTANQWGVLRQVYASLSAMDIDFPLDLYGTTRGLPEGLERYHHGLKSYFAMPDLYREASIVLDDYYPTAVEYGNTNSRVFEAIACGALPITNTGIGLEELELDMIPVYSDPIELRELIDRYLLDAAAAGTLSERLRSIVLGKHTFEIRAERFVTILENATAS